MQWVGFSFVWSRNCLDVKGRNAVYNFASFLQRSQTRDARDRRALHMTMSFFRICVLLYCAYSCDVRVIVSDYYAGLPKLEVVVRLVPQLPVGRQYPCFVHRSRRIPLLRLHCFSGTSYTRRFCWCNGFPVKLCAVMVQCAYRACRYRS